MCITKNITAKYMSIVALPGVPRQTSMTNADSTDTLAARSNGDHHVLLYIIMQSSMVDDERCHGNGIINKLLLL